MGSRGTLRLATRGSALARRQAAEVQRALEDRRYEVELVTVETRGDQIRDELIHRLGKTGAFVRSLDERVLEGDVDGAIHSMKDMPTESPDDLVVAGIPVRSRPGDVLVTPEAQTLHGLREGAVVGTSSLRRGAQLRRVRGDLVIEPLRGNVDTRVEKLLAPHRQREHERRREAESAEGDDEEFQRDIDAWLDDLAAVERRALDRRVDTEFDAVVLAAAGLERMGLLGVVPTESLPVQQFVPAAGQGALAVTALDGSAVSEIIHDVVDDPRTRVETTVERIVLAEVGGGCIAPIGVHAVIRGDHVHTVGQVLSQDGSVVVEKSRELPIEGYMEAAGEMAVALREAGAAELIEDARSEADGEAMRGEE